MYLGIDLGTSGVKAMLIDDGQQIIGSANGALTVSMMLPLGRPPECPACDDAPDHQP